MCIRPDGQQLTTSSVSLGFIFFLLHLRRLRVNIVVIN